MANTGFLEEIGGVKTARREAESILLAKALLRNEPVQVYNVGRMLKFIKKNKVLLRAAPLFAIPSETVEEARAGVAEAIRLYDLMSEAFELNGVSFTVIKTFDSLPDVGHDLDLLVPSASSLDSAKSLLIRHFKARPQGLTHCDRLLGKFSCFLPGFEHDFELYPAISQLGESHLDPFQVLENRRKSTLEGREVWLTSEPDRVLIRIIHAMFRHNFLKLSDILDFLNLIRNCSSEDILDGIEKARIGDAFIFYIASMDRFLKACEVENSTFQRLKAEAEIRFGRDRLKLLRRDRLVLPYRIPTIAIIMLFLLKGARDAVSGRWNSSLKCMVAPVLIILDFLSAAFRSGGRGGIW